MRNRLSLITVVLCVLAIPVASAMQGGVNEDPDITGSSVSSYDRDEVSLEGGTWSLSVTLTDEAVASGEEVSVTTQVCINDGVCYPPEDMELTSNDAKTFSGTTTPVEDHAYVNWRIDLTDANGEETRIPEEGWSRVWSDCWFYEEAWGGRGCGSETSSFLPSVGIATTISLISFTALLAPLARRDS